MGLTDLKMQSFMKKLDYLKSDFDYKQALVEEEDIEFAKMVNDILEENPNLKDLYQQKDNREKEKAVEDAIKKAEKEELEHQEESVEGNEGEDEGEGADENEDEGESPEKEEETEDTKQEPEKKEPKKESKKSSKLKKLYRKIVKMTHPDKVDDSKLNNYYLQATDAYDNNDIFTIYNICSKLGIEYEMEEHEMMLIGKKIDEYKNKIHFIEQTFTWKWASAPTEDMKKKIILQFINLKLSQ